MRQVAQFKALKPVPRSKRLREERERALFERDVVVAVRYAAMQRAATEHNVRVGAYAPRPRASPVIH